MCTIGDAWSFSGLAPIASSGGFSIETLIGVWLYHERPSQIKVSLLWKMKSLDCCITVIWAYCKEGSYCGRQAFRLDVDKKYHCGNVFSGQVDLAYDTIKL